MRDGASLERRGGPARLRAALVSRWPLWWAAGLAVLMLGPALAPGFVLSYDMVWVPDLGLGATALGLGTALPRAVPSDAVIAVLDEVVPGMLLQKAVLLGALVGGAPAIARLCGGPASARVVAVTFWVWNPFVVERLVLGAWPVLVAYAVAPWLLVHARQWCAAGQPGDRHAAGAAALGWLMVLIPAGSLSASAGLMSAVAVLAAALTRGCGAVRRWILLGLVVAAQAPWVVAGVLHAGDAVPAVPGFEIFAPSAEGFGSPLIAALSWGGVWNAEVVPLSRYDSRGLLYLGLLMLLAAAGAVRALSTARGAKDAPPWRSLAVCWLAGYGLVVVTALATAPLETLASEVPGLALLRDGSRLLGLAVPLVAILAGHGAAVIVAYAARLAGPQTGGVLLRIAIAGAAALAPIALLPDAAGGAAGRLQAVSYPSAYAALSAPDRSPSQSGATLVLPLSSYRAPAWNGGRPVLDPVPRLVGGDVIASGDLIVSGRRLPGEDPRAAAAAAALRLEPIEARQALRELGVGRVVLDVSAPQGEQTRRTAAAVLGPPSRSAQRGAGATRAGPLIEWGLAAPQTRAVPLTWTIATAAAWANFVGLISAGAVLVPLSWRRRKRDRGVTMCKSDRDRGPGERG